MNQSRINRITVLTILTLLLVSNFAFAQTPAPSKGNVVLTPEKEKAAQASPAECKKFRADVAYVFGDSTELQPNGQKQPNFKAVWWSPGGYYDAAKVYLGLLKPGCFIVPGYFFDTQDLYLRTGDYQPLGSQQIQALIKAGKGISSDQIATAAAQDLTAEQKAGPVSEAIGWVLKEIIGVVTSLVGLFTAMAGGIFTYTVAEITKVQSLPPVVDLGWTVVRDIANMLFILVLIVISFGSILRIEEYNYKNLLKNVVIMALLVNFSKEIALVLMNFTSIIVRMFSPTGDITKIFIFDIGIMREFGSAPNGWMAGLTDAIGQLVFALVSLFTFLVLAAMFLIRLVGLYVLIILSPAAYVLNILPATKNYAGQWWQHFIKYLIWAPVALFFVKLAAISAKGGLGDIGDLSTSAFRYFIVMGFMMAAVLVAKQAGMVGSEQVVNWGKKGVFGGAKVLGGAAVGFVGRGYSKYVSGKIEKAEGAGTKGWGRFWKTAQFANVRVAKEAYQQYAKEKEEEAYVPAVGKARDTIDRVIPSQWHRKIDEKTGEKTWKFGLGQKTYYGRIAQQSLINKKIKEWTEANLSEEEKAEAYNDSFHVEDQEALVTVGQEGRHEDGYMILAAIKRRDERTEELTKEFVGKGEKEDVARAKASEQAHREVPVQFDAIEYLDIVTKKMEQEGLSSEQIGARLAHLSEMAEAHNKIRGLGNEDYWHDGKFRAVNDFTGFEKLQNEKGVVEMLNRLEGTGAFDKVGKKPLIDSGGKTVLDAEGKPIEVIEKLEFKGHVVTDYKSLMEAMETTISGDKGKGENLRYTLVGARKQLSAQKRLDRGDTENWGGAFEPAAFMVQDEHGNFDRFTSYGERIFKNMSTLTINSFKKSRRLQARAAKMAGLYRDKDGKIDVKNTTTTKYDVMAKAFDMNSDFASAIVEKAELTQKDAEDAIAELDKYCTSHNLTPRTFTTEEVKKNHYTIVQKTLSPY